MSPFLSFYHAFFKKLAGLSFSFFAQHAARVVYKQDDYPDHKPERSDCRPEKSVVEHFTRFGIKQLRAAVRIIKNRVDRPHERRSPVDKAERAHSHLAARRILRKFILLNVPYFPFNYNTQRHSVPTACRPVTIKTKRKSPDLRLVISSYQ